MSITVFLRGNVETHAKGVESDLLVAESVFINDSDNSSCRDWKAKRRHYEILLLDTVNKRNLYYFQKQFEFGNKVGKLLAYFTKPNYSPTVIPNLTLSTGDKLTDHREIVQGLWIFMVPSMTLV